MNSPFVLFAGKFYPVFEGQDVSSLASYSQFLQDNEYNLTFWGDSGNPVTIFGNFDHATDRGFLIIYKLDNHPIYLSGLENFPENEWTEVGAEGVSKGKCFAYYYPLRKFQQDVLFWSLLTLMVITIAFVAFKKLSQYSRV
jgi:hypothetical protein